MLLIAKVITSFNLSTGSVLSAAARKYFGAFVHKSHILCIEDFGSKILIGIDICEIERPFSKFTANYLTTSPRTPFCLSNIY